MNFLSCPISLASVSAKAAASSPGMGRHCDFSQLRVRSFSENTLRIPSRLKKKQLKNYIFQLSPLLLFTAELEKSQRPGFNQR